jgi:hypothetical protein
MGTEWSINSDIYDIVDSVKKLQQRYIEDEDETTLSLGVFGFISDTEAKKIQTATILAGQLGNEMFPARASLTKNILAHAIYNGITDINATPARITLSICIRLEDINAHLVNNEDFYLDADCPIFIGDYEFHLDYDVRIRKIKVSADTYSYSAQYVLTDENDNRIINRLSNIINPYLNQPFPININGEEYLAIQCTVMQCTIEETTDTMVSDSIIENKSYTFEYSNQLADFRVVVTDNNEETEIVPYMYGSTTNPEDDNYCWYLYTAGNTVRITFDSKSFIPGLNSQIYIKAYTTLGADGNFEYLSVDQTSEGLYVDIESEKYGYNAITTYIVAVTDSSNGTDRKSKEELQQLIPKAAMARGSITTETDLNNYFNLINTDVNRLLLTKKVDNQLNRVWYAFFVLKDDFENIIPSNSINLQIDISNANYVSLSEDGRYILPAGTYLKFDPSTNIATPIDESTIPPEYSDEYYDSGYYYYITVYNIALDLDPLYAAFYLAITNHDAYFIYDYVNEVSDIQFIANRYHFERKLISDQSEYKMNFSIVQSVLMDENPLINTRTVTTENDEGETEEVEITTENLKVILVVYKNGFPYRWKECTYDNSLSDPARGLYYFNTIIGTDDTMDTKNNIKITGMNEAGSRNPVYGYIGEDCSASIYILTNIGPTPETDYPRKDLDDFAPGYEEYVVTNVYTCSAGLDFFENYTNVTDTSVKVVGENNYLISGVPCVGRHYLRTEDEVSYLIEAIKERKAYIDYCLGLIENSMNIDFKFFNTYGNSRIYKLEDKETPIGSIDISMKFKLSLKDSTDITTRNEIVKSIKKYIENLNDIGDLHIPNLITDIINEYEDRIYYIEFVGFNTFGTDDQHIIQVDENVDVPEFINIRNVIDSSTGLIVPDIEITLV